MWLWRDEDSSLFEPAIEKKYTSRFSSLRSEVRNQDTIVGYEFWSGDIFSRDESNNAEDLEVSYDILMSPARYLEW